MRTNIHVRENNVLNIDIRQGGTPSTDQLESTQIAFLGERLSFDKLSGDWIDYEDKMEMGAY